MDGTSSISSSPSEALGRIAPFPIHQWRPLVSSVAVLPGDAASLAVLQHENMRRRLLGLVQQFSVYGYSNYAGQANKISRNTRLAASAFLEYLPATKALPRIAPDGEGGLIMVWELNNNLLLITVDELQLHAVISATTPCAIYIDPILLDQTDIPDQLLSKIPDR